MLRVRLIHLFSLVLIIVGSSAASAQLPVPAVPGVPGAGQHLSLAANEELKGLFKIKKGECQGTTGATGSYFQMLTFVGEPITNNTSPCSTQTSQSSFNPLTPGADGGLSTTGFQPHPNPVFDSSGNAKAKRIVEPSKFYGVDFAVATTETDPQSNTQVIVPRIIHDGNGKISSDSDLRAFGAAWNNSHYNQGAPKPDGSTPAPTKRASGTYNPTTKAFVIEWQSKIVGGTFDNNSGKWHLEGTFDPSVTNVGEAPKLPPLTVKSNVRRGPRPASTGPAVPPWMGGTIFALGISGFVLDRSLARRRRVRQTG